METAIQGVETGIQGVGSRIQGEKSGIQRVGSGIQGEKSGIQRVETGIQRPPGLPQMERVSLSRVNSPRVWIFLIIEKNAIIYKIKRE